MQQQQQIPLLPPHSLPMASSHLLPLFLLMLSMALTPLTTAAAAAAASSSSLDSRANSSTLDTSTSVLRSLCNSTPHPDTCFNTLKLSINTNIGISIGIGPSILTYALHALQAAISEATKITSLLPPTTPSVPGIVEKQRGAIQDCKDLHQITVSALQKSASLVESISAGGTAAARKTISDVNAYLSAALTNKNTCLQGLQGASGPMLPTLVQDVADAYKHVSNSLSIVAKSSRPAPPTPAGGGNNKRRLRKLLGFPSWLSRRDRRILQSGDYDSDGDNGGALTLTVAKDGSGNFTRVGDAVAYAPSNNGVRTFIMVKAGVYEENVDVPADKINIVLLGDGKDVTVIRGSRSATDGWTSFRSATVAVAGQGFLARDIAFENVAGASKGQAAALRVNADLAAFYQCTISGYQDTLYVHSFRQFYRECDVLGTVDFIFGNAAVIFQACNLIARVPVHGQANVITAQGRDDPNEDTGISIHRCSIVASGELQASPGSAKTFLGRPWQPYSRTVVMESSIDGLVDPAGWLNWIGDQGLDTLYYGEYENSGPGSGTDNRVDWPGYHVMEYDDAVEFTVSEFIDGDEWLGSTSFPYDDGV